MGEVGFFENTIFSMAAGDDALRRCFPFGTGVCRESWSFVEGMLSPLISESAIPEFFGTLYGCTERLLAPAISISLLVFSFIKGSRTGSVVGVTVLCPRGDLLGVVGAGVLCPRGDLLYVLGVVSVDGSSINT